MKTLCGDCLFWRINGNGSQQPGAGRLGQCHRYAPRAMVDHANPEANLTRWPRTFEQEWCGDGEHK